MQARIEDEILTRETAYLEETGAGNIIKGFDNYIKGTATTTSAASGGGPATRRKAVINDTDRIFSRSSTNFLKVCRTAPWSAQIHIHMMFGEEDDVRRREQLLIQRSTGTHILNPRLHPNIITCPDTNILLPDP
jgi:hypothetical protein